MENYLIPINLRRSNIQYDRSFNIRLCLHLEKDLRAVSRASTSALSRVLFLALKNLRELFAIGLENVARISSATGFAESATVTQS